MSEAYQVGTKSHVLNNLHCALQEVERGATIADALQSVGWTLQDAFGAIEQVRDTEVMEADDDKSPFIENGCVICPHCGAADKITYAFDIPYYADVVVQTDEDGDSMLVTEHFEACWDGQSNDRAWCRACGKDVDITDIEME